MVLILLWSLLWIGTPAAADYRVAPLVGEAGPDLTQQFYTRLERPVPLDVAVLKQYKLLLLPGFMADLMEQTIGYFTDPVRALEELGLKQGPDFETIMHQFAFSGEQTIANNALAIERAILSSDRPVFLITHSKGSADALEALLNSPAARAKVKGWIAVQSAFGGSVFADVGSSGYERWLVSLGLGYYEGNIGAIEDLTLERRLSYLFQRRSEIERLASELPILTVATWKLYVRWPRYLQLLGLFYDKNYWRDVSDGIVEIRHALLPAVPWVLLRDVDHGETFQNDHGTFDRPRFLRAMLSALVEGAR